MNTRKVSTSFIMAMTVCLVAQGVWAQIYKVTDLGTQFPTSYSSGGAINRCGHVAGFERASGNDPGTGFFWSQPTGTVLLKALPRTIGTSGLGINRFDSVVGYSGLNDNHAVYWIDGKKLRPLRPLAGATISIAIAINDRGHIAGSSDSKDYVGSPHAVLWPYGESIQDLGVLPGGCCSDANALNIKDEVVGESNTADNHWHGFSWTKPSGMQDLGTLPNSTDSSARSVNDFGVIAGNSENGNCYGCTDAVIWDTDGRIVDLGRLPGADTSDAFGINNSGDVVGGSGNQGLSHAFIWRRRVGMQDLNDLILPNSGWLLIGATAINDGGQITGGGIINGESHAFLLTPIGKPGLGCD